MLPALQHPLNILRHNLPHPFNLPLRRAQRILLPRIRAALLQHQLLQQRIETCTPVRRQIRKMRILHIEFCEEFLLQIR